MTQGYVMPKGALLLLVIGMVPAALTMLDLFDVPNALELLLAGAGLVGIGILWHLVARYQYKMDVIRKRQVAENAKG